MCKYKLYILFLISGLLLVIGVLLIHWIISNVIDFSILPVIISILSIVLSIYGFSKCYDMEENNQN